MEIRYIIRKTRENPNFSDLFKRIVNRFKNVGYNLDIMRQTACLVCNPIIGEGDGLGLRLNDQFNVKL